MQPQCKSCSQTGLYGLGTFSAIFGPEMASEANFPWKGGGGGGGGGVGMPLDPPNWCAFMQALFHYNWVI